MLKEILKISFINVTKLFLKKKNVRQSIYSEVEKEIQTNRNNFKRFIFKKEPLARDNPNSKKKTPKFRRIIPHTRNIENSNKLQEFLENDDLWDVLINWKNLLGENIYLQRSVNKNK